MLQRDGSQPLPADSHVSRPPKPGRLSAPPGRASGATRAHCGPPA